MSGDPCCQCKGTLDEVGASNAARDKQFADTHSVCDRGAFRWYRENAAALDAFAHRLCMMVNPEIVWPG